jgi:hypothetical protein
MFSIEIGALDRTIIYIETATHVGPVDVTGCGVYNYAVRKSAALTHNRLQVRAIWLA